jgi:putative endopeptidase
MSAAAKTEAKAKLDKLKIEIGAPKRDLDYSVQPMGRGSFGGNMLIASTWRHREEMKRIGRGNADRRWDVLPQQPALAYDIAQNRLIVTAAMLQAPVLDMTQDTAAQYGAFGALVGHELTHGFDKSGRMVDATATVRDWWTPADLAAWETRAGQLATQYGVYPYPGLTASYVNGGQTRDENLADLGGVELAWDALATTQPALTDVSKQTFYQGWARLWPQQMSTDIATRLAATDVHAPGQWRTNGPLANDPGFGAAFTCKVGTPMQRAPDQQVKLWR